MVQDLTAALYAKSFRWKPSSLECLASVTAQNISLSMKLPTSETLIFKDVDNMTALGVLLDRSGSTSTSVSHRM
eukprot:9657789-Karenia_brevis.AAC.1